MSLYNRLTETGSQKNGWRFVTIFKQKCSNMRPLLSITFPQGFWISKNIWHPTSGSGGKFWVVVRLSSGRWYYPGFPWPPSPTRPTSPLVVQVRQEDQVGQVGRVGQVGQVGPVGQVWQVGQVGQIGKIVKEVKVFILPLFRLTGSKIGPNRPPISLNTSQTNKKLFDHQLDWIDHQIDWLDYLFGKV